MAVTTWDAGLCGPYVVVYNCPGGREMPGHVFVDAVKCTGCGECVPKCPVEAMSGELGRPPAVDPSKCDGCGECFRVCPEGAMALADGADAVLWLLAGAGRAALEADDALASALPGVGRRRLVSAAREVLDRGLAGRERRASTNGRGDGFGAAAGTGRGGGAPGSGRTDPKGQGVVLPPIIAYSVEMGRVLQLAAKVALVNTTVLILGESGVGKEVVARFIHGTSPRREGPFVTINCGAIPATLLESELFGYESGAFTGARREGKPGMIDVASCGTLFLDEISELPGDLQVKLLQVIQERRLTRVGGVKPVDVDIRIIAATNRDLAGMVAKGEFRADLFYRLNVVPITIPPLRERPDDVIPLIYHFLERFNRAHGYRKAISEDAREILARYSWPGNVRELENLVERLVVTVEGDEIGPGDLPRQVLEERGLHRPGVVVGGIMPLRQAVEEVERQIIQRALSEKRSTYSIARLLGVNQSTVVRKIKKYAVGGHSGRGGLKPAAADGDR
ncbi:MAG: sigma 54-interacting transcriptional regulator [Bacillota bacterium]|nr:sigma 54-interacting transcriptional regulator [Bacillota bacterium]